MSARIPYLAGAVAAAIVLVGAMTFAGPCAHGDGTLATCHDAQVAVIAGSAVALVVLAAAGFLRQKAARIALPLIAACSGAFVAAAPGTLFPLCMMATMRCHTIMQPFAQIGGVVVLALSLVALVRALRGEGKA